jgi:protein gp37
MTVSRSKAGWADFAGQDADFIAAGYCDAVKMQRLAKWQPSPIPLRRGPESKPMCSLCDVFDPKVPRWVIEDCFKVLYHRADIDWQIVTHHIDRAAEMLRGFPGVPHIWLGCSVEDQRSVEQRLPVLTSLQQFPVTFLRVTSLAEPIRLPAPPPWVICDARPATQQLVVDLLQDVRGAGMKFWYGAYLLGKVWQEWPT